MISIYKLQNVSPYCLINQVNKILGIRNSEIWLFDDVSKISVSKTSQIQQILIIMATKYYFILNNFEILNDNFIFLGKDQGRFYDS